MLVGAHSSACTAVLHCLLAVLLLWSLRRHLAALA